MKTDQAKLITYRIMRLVAIAAYFKRSEDVHNCTTAIRSILEDLPEPSLWTTFAEKSKFDRILGYLLAINVFAQVLFWGFYLGILYARHKGTL